MLKVQGYDLKKKNFFIKKIKLESDIIWQFPVPFFNLFLGDIVLFEKKKYILALDGITFYLEDIKDRENRIQLTIDLDIQKVGNILDEIP